MDHRVLPLWCALHCRLFMAKLSFVVQPLFHGSLFGSSLFFLCDLFLVMQLVHPSIFLIDPNVLLLASGTHGALFGSCHLLLALDHKGKQLANSQPKTAQQGVIASSCA